MAAPGTAATAVARCSPSRAVLQVINANDGVPVAAPTTLAVAEPQPVTRETACGETAASHAVRRGLPRIVAANAASYPPPSLNSFRTEAARAPADSAPALWYWQLTGDEWQRDGHGYELAKKSYRRMLDEHKAAERERDRSGRKRPVDDGAQAARRSRAKREAEQRAAAAEYRVVDTHMLVIDGHVHVLVAPSEVCQAPIEPDVRRPLIPHPLLMPRFSPAMAGHLLQRSVPSPYESLPEVDRKHEAAAHRADLRGRRQLLPLPQICAAVLSRRGRTPPPTRDRTVRRSRVGGEKAGTLDEKKALMNVCRRNSYVTALHTAKKARGWEAWRSL